MSTRIKRVQVGWYCDHESEKLGECTHIRIEYKRGKQVEVKDTASHRTHFSIQGLDYRDQAKKPPCPKTEPVYAYREVESDASEKVARRPRRPSKARTALPTRRLRQVWAV